MITNKLIKQEYDLLVKEGSSTLANDVLITSIKLLGKKSLREDVTDTLTRKQLKAVNDHRFPDKVAQLMESTRKRFISSTQYNHSFMKMAIGQTLI